MINYLNKKNFIYFKIIFFSILLSAYLYEIYYINSYFGLKKFINLKDDKITSNYKNILPPSNFLEGGINMKMEIFPLSGLPNSLTLHCNENGYFSKYTSDKYGFNNNNNIWYNENKENIYLLGDSFVHGACVNPENTFAKVLSKKSSNKINFYNLGYSGNGPLINFAVLKEFFLIKKPSKVFWFHTEVNDLIDLSKEIDNPILNKYLNFQDYNQNYVLNYKYLTTYLSKINDQVSISNQKKDIIFKFLKLYHLRKNLKNIEYNKKNLDYEFDDNYKKILLNADAYLKKNDSELYFIYLPSWFRFNNESFKYTALEQQKNIQTFLNKNNIKFIDVNKLFFENKNNKNLYFPFGLNGHYNELGYNRISEVIYKNIF